MVRLRWLMSTSLFMFSFAACAPQDQGFIPPTPSPTAAASATPAAAPTQTPAPGNPGAGGPGLPTTTPPATPTIPAPTGTATALPTATPVPPTATAVPTQTPTPVPPTPTRVPPTPTHTPVPPTPTATRVPPTSTPLPTATPTARVYTVNSTADAPDAAPGNGICATQAGQCTLRAAVMQANAAGGKTRIVLADATYTLSIPGPEDDSESGNAATGDLDITADIIIVGNGADIVGGPDTHDRLFHVHPSGVLTMDRVTLRGGRGQVAGGGVYNQGALTVTNAAIVENVNDVGGGIANRGTMALTDVTVRGNISAPGDGAGIANLDGGTATLTRVLVTDNHTEFSGHAGGIYNSGTMTIVSSTISNNQAISGGGIATSGTLTLRGGCRVTGNTAVSTGGGIRVYTGTLDLGDTVVSGNTPDNVDRP